MEYPKFTSHKVVGAVQVEHVEKCADGSIKVHLAGGFDPVTVQHADRNHKPHPEAGWYLVQYEDGYISFSPKKAFEEGYLPVKEGSSAGVQHIVFEVMWPQQLPGNTPNATADPGALAPHQQRVIAEKSDLDEKLTKLSAFMDGPVFLNLEDDGEAYHLSRQLGTMIAYSAILGERIAAFGNPAMGYNAKAQEQEQPEPETPVQEPEPEPETPVQEPEPESEQQEPAPEPEPEQQPVAQG